ncbi:adenosine/AMP deaminase [[Clostridium] sordellii]|uniref:hypothetical protein n=1 Tax=Paraclostridium sordellii TaxID=1505 RepID=UPI0005DCC901|nr:hypothetical protein [Paeniclostridium sordellii]CEN75145.1 adenosine/AMP deaminase [[Clostridium] sordellii] [Paeniclostridium sordellii]
MDIKRALNEVVFSKIPVELLIDKLSENRINKIDYSSIKYNLKQYLVEVIPGYSEDEREQIIYYMQQILEKEESGGIFSLLNSFNQEVLIEYNYKPYCKYEQLMRWRMLSHKLEQDLLITSYFAKNDSISKIKRTNFTWEPIIKTDNVRLHNMLKKGMSENHFHLKGSAPHFNLTWISLMNRISARDFEYKKSGIMNNRLNPDGCFSEIKKKQSIKDLVTKAAIIRMYLFRELLEIELGKDKVPNLNLNYLDIVKILKQDASVLSLKLANLSSNISILRELYGLKINYKGQDKTVDYAIRKNVITPDNNNYKCLLYGERKFMYDCFKLVFDTNENKFKNYETLLHIYILIKGKLRAELVQINDRVGFKNFSDYQDRKTIFLKREPILKDAIYYMAVRGSIEDQRILSLESRICHENTTLETHKEINNINSILSRSSNENWYPHEDRYNIYVEKKKERKNNENEDSININHFYVIHIPKLKDIHSEKIIKNGKKYLLRIRDNERRLEAKKLAHQIMTIRESRVSAAKMIYGIDACSNEIGCRPEVFSQAFRCLKYHTLYSEYNKIKEQNVSINKIHPIRITYHAGEDFLDVIDGLRAIDEAIKFLNMRHGERIGHGLALGIDVEKWYKTKMNTIILSKQDYLDNLAWILNKIQEYKINTDVFFKNRLEQEFNNLYLQIYGFDNINYLIYYQAWLLRGDNPELYCEGRYKNAVNIRYWDRHAINNNVDIDRSNENITNIYYKYHYDFNVRKKGSEVIDIKISNDYINLTKKIQKHMQKEIINLGIAIETNPSSNYLIGTFKRYDEHPILNFYNLGLTYDQQKINNCPQLFVSINTDDQGVFGTYLENEYALLAIGLEKAKDENGNKLYNTEMIYDWLDNIREMGIQQSFGYNVRQSNIF